MVPAYNHWKFSTGQEITPCQSDPLPALLDMSSPSSIQGDGFDP